MRVRNVAMTLVAFLLVSGLAVAQAVAVEAPQYGQDEQTVTGTVVSSEAQLLVIRTDRGQLRFDVTQTARMPDQDLREGDQVRIHYRATDSGNEGEIVRVQRLDEGSMGTDGERARAEQPAREGEMGTDGERARAGERERLPRTAGNLPMIGIIGALALAGAAGIGVASRLF